MTFDFLAKDFNLAKDYQIIFFPRLFRFYLQALNIMETAIIFIGCYDNNSIGWVCFNCFFNSYDSKYGSVISWEKDAKTLLWLLILFFTSKHLTYKFTSFKMPVSEYYWVWSRFVQNLVPYHQIFLICCIPFLVYAPSSSTDIFGKPFALSFLK